jgi:hypothetical protein
MSVRAGGRVAQDCRDLRPRRRPIMSWFVDRSLHLLHLLLLLLSLQHLLLVLLVLHLLQLLLMHLVLYLSGRHHVLLIQCRVCVYVRACLVGKEHAS